MLTIYKDPRTIFRLVDIAMLTGESDFMSLNKKLNYYVQTGNLLNLRKGIYAKTDYNTEELGCLIYKPAYISLEYVLQQSGIVFQYDPGVTVVSYLSRNIEVAGQAFRFRKIKGEILVNTEGIIRKENHVNIASPERAFLDLLYLNSKYYFDHLNPVSIPAVKKLLPLYGSKTLSERALKLLKND
ncbi:MAG: hypothetical protein WD577_11595 [Bacteroidales bacterium]